MLGRAGVVDAGGRGLVVLLDVLEAVVAERAVVLPASVTEGATRLTADSICTSSPEAPSPAYEVMYLIDTDDARVPALRAALDEIGEAVVVSGGDGLWNVHVHTDDAPAAVELGAAAGRPHDVRVTEIGDARAADGLADGGDRVSAGRVVAVVLAPSSARLPICDLLTRSGAYIVEAAELVELGASELVVLVEDAGLAEDDADARGNAHRARPPRRAGDRRPCPSRSVSRRRFSSCPQWRCTTRTGRSPTTQRRWNGCRQAPATVVVGPAADDELFAADRSSAVSRLLAAGGDLVTVVSAEGIGARIAEDLAGSPARHRREPSGCRNAAVGGLARGRVMAGLDAP